MVDISVIIPVYNAEKHLEECIRSVCAQTVKDIEILCVDDGSSDGSLAILQRLAQEDPRVKVICQENAGAGAARNHGLRLARGKYLSFLDADDFFDSHMLEKAFEKRRPSRRNWWSLKRISTTKKWAYLRLAYMGCGKICCRSTGRSQP